jgi:RNA polymerase sigma factor (sigma-70 family)
VNDRAVDEVAQRAITGDRDAVEALVRILQGDIYALSLRMVWNREDAEDATQEILIRVITRLSSFDFRSRLKTWAYRVAVNYLLDAKRSAVERMNLNFVRLSDDLEEGLAADGPAEDERSVLIEEVKIGCTLAMLQCLDRPHRLAYILGEILDLPGPEAADALDIDPSVLRKRLERARSAILTFTRSHCGLVSDDAACRCNRRVPAAVRLGRARPGALEFADRAVSFDEVRTAVRRAEEARRALEVHRSSRPRESSVELSQQIVAAIDAITGWSPDQTGGE